jgi:hypothetical protein
MSTFIINTSFIEMVEKTNPRNPFTVIKKILIYV